MTIGTNGVAATPQEFSNSDVLEAHFRLETATEGTEPAQNLFLRTYTRSRTKISTWHAMPDKDWPLLATEIAP